MFNRKCLYNKALLERREEYKGVPDFFEEMWSSQFWFFLDNDFIEKIVAIRIFPYQDRIALKLLPRNTKSYTNLIIREPELRILKRIWECGHKGFNSMLMEYMKHSSSCFQQWVKRTSQNHGCFDWYMDLNLGAKHG